MVTCGEREAETGSIGIGDEDVQNIMYKLSYNNRMYNTGHIARFYNNYKWNITSKNCESCSSYNIVYQIYISIKIEKMNS